MSMYDYPKYEQKKFRCTGTHEVPNLPEDWWKDTNEEKGDFVMTRGYKEYIYKKKKEMAAHEIRLLKSRIEYQIAKYGEPDQMDIDEFIYKVNKYNKLYK